MMVHSVSTQQPHVPVLLDEMLDAVAPQDNQVIVDGTFGAGGYTRAILDAAACHVIGLDRDPSVMEHVQHVKQAYGERFSFQAGRFGDMASLLKQQGRLDAIVLDIGVSSMQLDQAQRGFSFRYDAPLDMRMSDTGITAADIVNQYTQQDIAQILWEYGEERASRRIAAAIIKQREQMPITTTQQLRSIIRSVLPQKGQPTDTATRSFQALRIAVNEELLELQRALHAAEYLLKEGGRLVVVTFHSLEDRIVKQFMVQASQSKTNASRHLPTILEAQPVPTFIMKRRKALSATEEEVTRNPRARSAKLRVAIRSAAPAREVYDA